MLAPSCSCYCQPAGVYVNDHSSIHRDDCHSYLHCACWMCCRFGLVYGILVVLGIGTLLPLNVFLTEKEFFDIRLHVEPVQPTVANNFLSLFGLVFNGA
jgi:hypothetical protein